MSTQLPDDYVGHALVGQIDGRGSKHVIWVNNRSGSRAAAWPPDTICDDRTWATVEPLYQANALKAHDAQVASEAAEKAWEEGVDAAIRFTAEELRGEVPDIRNPYRADRLANDG